MNRREALTSFASAIGTGAVIKTIDAEPKPLLFVLECDETIALSDEDVNIFVKQWNDHLWKGNPPAPLIVLPSGTKLSAILHPDHQKLSLSPTI